MEYKCGRCHKKVSCVFDNPIGNVAVCYSCAHILEEMQGIIERCKTRCSSIATLEMIRSLNADIELIAKRLADG